MADQRPVLARREFTSDEGDFVLEFRAGAGPGPSCEFEMRDAATGLLLETGTTYGVDSLQALLFCITAAGDYLRSFVPSAGFADLGVTGLLTTDLSDLGRWCAQVSIPLDPATDVGDVAGEVGAEDA